MDTAKVKELLLQLNHQWFLDKRDLFEREVLYHPQKGRIYEVVTETFIDRVGNAVDNKRGITIDIDLPHYCWSSYFPDSIRSTNDPTPIYIPIDASEIANAIASLLQEYTESFTNITSIYNSISSVVSEVRNTVQELKGVKSRKSKLLKEYELALDLFCDRTYQQIWGNYSYIKNQIAELSYEDRLEFKLSQVDLLRTLLVWNYCGFLNTTGYTDTDFLQFCQKYFYFHKAGSYRPPKNSDSFAEEYRKLYRGDLKKAMEPIKRRIDEAYRDL